MSEATLKRFQDLVVGEGRRRSLMQSDICSSIGRKPQALGHFFSVENKNSKPIWVALRLCSFLGISDREAYLALGMSLPPKGDIDAKKTSDISWDYEKVEPIPPSERRPTKNRFTQALGVARLKMGTSRGSPMTEQLVFIYGNTTGCSRSLLRLGCNLDLPTPQGFRGYSGVATKELIAFAKEKGLQLKDRYGNVITKVKSKG